MNLETLFPKILPLAIEWGESQAKYVKDTGVPLPDNYVETARRVGVKHPERIRTKLVNKLPMPEEPILREAAMQTGLLGADMVGLTLGYSIFVVFGYESVPLISHECRHVHQYEKHGSIERFLTEYLRQIIEYGYSDAPLELDARAHEI